MPEGASALDPLNPSHLASEDQEANRPDDLQSTTRNGRANHNAIFPKEGLQVEVKQALHTSK